MMKSTMTAKKIIQFTLLTMIAFCWQIAFGNEGVSTLPAQKKAFVGELQELSKVVNAKILSSRNKILQLSKLPENKLSSADKTWLAQIAKKYQIKDWSPNTQSDWEKLLSKVDIVPTSLVVAQAAIESAWGTSRFAKTGNNFFGQWCYQKGCGIVPLQRPAGRQYEVQKFATPTDAINAYIHNLNTNHTYRLLREKRMELREENKPISGYALAEGLKNYSQLGEKYIKIVQGVIKRYGLSQLNHHNKPKQSA